MLALIFSLLIVLLLVHVNISCAFLLPYNNKHIILYAATGENNNHEAESDKTPFSLPAIGESSYDANKSSDDYIRYNLESTNMESLSVMRIYL